METKQTKKQMIKEIKKYVKTYSLSWLNNKPISEIKKIYNEGLEIGIIKPEVLK